MDKKNHPGGWLHIVQGLDRSGEKPYCTFIICIRFHFVNKRLHLFFKRLQTLRLRSQAIAASSFDSLTLKKKGRDDSRTFFHRSYI
jgi:hypothetical protein